MESMEEGGAAAADIERSNKVRSDPSQPRGWEPDKRTMRGRKAYMRGRQVRGAGLRWGAGLDCQGHWGVGARACGGVPGLTAWGAGAGPSVHTS